MVRAPCCEKMGLKKGPWMPEEDQILVAHIHRYGHGNWRALPKQAGLLRCGKSCRLRWMNYLRPDIKRGSFTKEEEEMIISLHEMLGNRWSAIAAKLPGRTDNEIKNVWHTHLKKRVTPTGAAAEQAPKRKKKKSEAKNKEESAGTANLTDAVNPAAYDDSPGQSCSDDFSSCVSVMDSSTLSGETTHMELPQIDESFWLEALSMDNSDPLVEFGALEVPSAAGSEPLSSLSSANSDDLDYDMDYWVKVFMEAGMHDLPRF